MRVTQIFEPPCEGEPRQGWMILSDAAMEREKLSKLSGIWQHYEINHDNEFPQMTLSRPRSWSPVEPGYRPRVSQPAGQPQPNRCVFPA